MSFNVSSVVSNNDAKITLAGELDASSAAQFKAELETILANPPRRLVFLVSDLEFMASAGLRVLIFAQQKVGKAVPIHFIAPQGSVLDTLEKTGFIHSVYIEQEYCD